MDWCSSINKSVNDVVLYIGTSFNYTEAFSLLQLIVITLTGLQEPYEVCHLLEWNFNSLRISYNKQWKRSLQALRSSISQPLFTVIITKREESSPQYINMQFFWIQWCQTANIMAAKGMCVGYISSLISQKRKVTWNFQLQKPIVGYKCNLYGYNKRFLFPVQFPLHNDQSTCEIASKQAFIKHMHVSS